MHRFQTHLQKTEGTWSGFGVSNPINPDHMKTIHCTVSYFFAACLFLTGYAYGQPLADTLLVWDGYYSKGTTHISIYPNLADTTRPYTLVLRELAENAGPNIVDDLTYLAEEAGRALQVDPARINWILHWGAFSFKGAKKSRKELFLRATFKRNKNRQLGRPQWRLASREEVELLTDRTFY